MTTKHPSMVLMSSHLRTFSTPGLFIFLFLSATVASTADGGGDTTFDSISAPPAPIDPTKLTFKLSFQWPQGYCKTKGSGCEKAIGVPNHFTIHGLWPIYRGKCQDSTQKFSIDLVKSIKDELIKNWPNLKYFGQENKYETFWDHEWVKHGTRCSLYDVFGYFDRSLKLLQASNVLHTLVAAGKPTTVEGVKKAFSGKEPYVLCKEGSDKKYYFYQLEFCLDHSQGYVNCPKKSEKAHCIEGKQFSYGDSTTNNLLLNHLVNLVDSLPAV